VSDRERVSVCAREIDRSERERECVCA